MLNLNLLLIQINLNLWGSIKFVAETIMNYGE